MDYNGVTIKVLRQSFCNYCDFVGVTGVLVKGIEIYPTNDRFKNRWFFLQNACEGGHPDTIAERYGYNKTYCLDDGFNPEQAHNNGVFEAIRRLKPNQDTDKTNGIELTNSKGWKAYLQHDTTHYWLNSNVDTSLSGSKDNLGGFRYGYLMCYAHNGLNDALKNAKCKGYTRDTIQSTITQTTMKGKTIIMDLITKLKKLTRKEPEKSLIEQGVTDESGVLTTEGYKAFVQFLFDSEDNKKAFYEGVVKPIVDAEKK